MNNIQTIGGHVVIAHQADWTNTPELQRIWRTPVDTALTGVEGRKIVRHSSWLKLEYEILPFNHVERARMEDRIFAALKVGKAAVPHWGRGVPLLSAAAIGATTLTLERDDHDIAVDTYCIIQSSIPAEFDQWETVLLTDVAGANLTLSTALTKAYEAGVRIWPLLFGRLVDEMKTQMLNTTRGRTKLAIQYDRHPVSPEAFEDFGSYALGTAGTLNGGEGWNGAWVIGDAA